MKQKLTALLLALAMIFSICAMSAIAGETPAPESGEADVTADETADETAAEEGESAEAAEEEAPAFVNGVLSGVISR